MRFACLALPIGMGLKAQITFGRIPVYFEENRGQRHTSARYIVRSANEIGFVIPEGLMLSLTGEAIAMRIIDADPNARMAAEGEVGGVANYYLGKRSFVGLKHYSRVRVSNIRPGIDILYHGNGQSLEYDLVIHPGANPKALRFRFEGGPAPRIADDGDLVFKTAKGELRQHPPRVWQGDKQDQVIECKYVLSGPQEVRLQLTNYDRSRDLVIDPILSYATFLGGSNPDSVTAIAANSAGNAYVTGWTQSPDFPVTSGTLKDLQTAFVTELTADGTGLIYSTYISGNQLLPDQAENQPYGIALDPSGNAYITGSTNSVNFPFTNGAYVAGYDAFVLKLGTTGAIVYATALAGSGSEAGGRIVVDSSGAAYIAGSTTSRDFPVTTGSFQAKLPTTKPSGNNAGFAAKIAPSGQISYATFLSGTANEGAGAIAVDALGDAFIGGSTNSLDFPVTAGAYATALKGESDAFVAMLNPTGSALVFSTYLGGSLQDGVAALAVDTTGCYVAGNTGSSDFPTTTGAFATVFPAPNYTSGFITKLNLSGTALLYSTYLGGNSVDSINDMAIDSGSVYVVGTEFSGNFPTTTGALRRRLLGVSYYDSDMFLTELSPDGSTLSYSTLLGDTYSGEGALGVALDGNGGVYVGGWAVEQAEQPNYFFPTTPGAFQAKPPKTGQSGAVAKIDFSSLTLCTPSDSPQSQNLPGTGGAISFNLTLAAGCPWEAIASQFITLNAPATGVVSSSPVTITGVVGQNNSIQGSVSGTVRIGPSTFTVNQSAGSCQQPVVNPTPVTFDSNGGATSLSLTLSSQCTWSAVSSAPWLSVSANPSGTGPASITITAGQNSFSQRSATLTIAGLPITVTQSGSTCTATASAMPLSFSGSGGTGVASITTSSSSCAWIAYSEVPWIQVTSLASSGQGPGEVGFIIAGNPSPMSRTGYILIADQILTITQTAGPAGFVSGYSVSLFAGQISPSLPANGDGGPAISAHFNNLHGLRWDSATGTLYVVDSYNSGTLLRAITPDGNINTVAGGGSSIGENIPATSADLGNTFAIGVDQSSAIYFSDLTSRVRRMSAGNIATFAGGDYTGFSGDNAAATSALLDMPEGFAADPAGNIYISDMFNHRVREVSGGIITTAVGGGTRGLGDGGAATLATLQAPYGLVFDGAGNLYIADAGSSLVRKVSNGIITTFAGGGSGGDGGPATQAALSEPTDVAADALGNVFILEPGYLRIRRVSPDGTISTISSYGAAPQGLTTDPSGNVYYTDNGQFDAVRKLTPLPGFCTYSVTAVSGSFVTGQSNGVVGVTAASGCAWTASSNNPAWLTITNGSSGTGSGSVGFSLAANPSSMARTGSLTIGAQTINVTQGGLSSPAALSVTPNAGTGLSRTFALQFSDAAGVANLQQVWVYFNTKLANPATSACMLYYNNATNQIYLLNDYGTAWLQATLGAASTLQNSQCSLNVAASTVALNTNTLTLNVAMAFKPSFTGVKNVYLKAVDILGSSSGWEQGGTWIVGTLAGTPAAVSVTPGSGSGTSQSFALQYSDSAGAASLQQVWAYFNATLANPAGNACMLYYQASTNQINLLNDSGTAWLPATLGSATTLQNSQCSVNVESVTVALSGNTLTLTLTVTFKSAFAGARNVYLRAVDVSRSNGGWQQLGTWTVTSSSGTASTVSMMPNSGSGNSQTFTVQYSDTAGAASLEQAWVYFNATLANPASNACLLYYNAPTNQINLLNDNATEWMPATIGSATTLQNSQCALNVEAGTVSPSGNTLTLTVVVRFKPAFDGAKNVYLRAVDTSGSNSGWQQSGNWTVAFTPGTPSTVSVTPDSGSSATQTFTLQYSDTQGAANLQQVWVYFNATLANPASGACVLYYNAPASQINLLNDNATAWLPATVGTAAILQNGQCSLNVAATTVTLNGNTLTLNVPLTFKPAFDGAKSVYLHAVDVGGSNSGWQQLGGWTP